MPERRFWRVSIDIFFPPRGLEGGQGSVGALGLCLPQFPAGTSALSPVLLLLLQEFGVNKLHSLGVTGISALSVIRAWASLINFFRVESAVLRPGFQHPGVFRTLPKAGTNLFSLSQRTVFKTPNDLSFFKAFFVNV